MEQEAYFNLNRIYNKIIDLDWFSADFCHVISARLRGCPVTVVQFELIVIGYPRDSHVNYGVLMVFFAMFPAAFKNNQKTEVYGRFRSKEVLKIHF